MSDRITAPFHIQKPGWLDEFRAFIMRGNVVDLAVGIIIGVAFTAVVLNIDYGDFLHPACLQQLVYVFKDAGLVVGVCFHQGFLHVDNNQCVVFHFCSSFLSNILIKL